MSKVYEFMKYALLVVVAIGLLTLTKWPDIIYAAKCWTRDFKTAVHAWKEE